MNALNTASNGIDNWNAALKYKNGPLSAGLAYAAFEGFTLASGEVLDNTHLFGLGLGYQIGDFSLGFTYENGDASLVYGDAQNYYVSGAYTFGNNVIQAAYGYVDPKDEDSVNNYVLGFQHNFSKRTGLWVEYIGRGANVNDTKRQVFFGDQSIVSIGIRHDF
jgi:predicted porin